MRFIFLFIIYLILLSCEKQRIGKIENKWQLVRVSKIKEATHYEEWHFDNGTITMIENPKDSAFVTPDTLATGSYSFESKFTTQYLIFSNIGDKRPLYNGRWRVLNVNNEILILNKNDDKGWFYREFLKI